MAIGVLLGLCGSAIAAGKASHFVLIVWDGMRPDLVSQENTPTLFEMSHRGVTFLHHHPVYVSSTEVNGTALATGVYPGESTIIGNDEFRPLIDPRIPVQTQSLGTIRKGDSVMEGHFLAVQTVSEILHEKGLRTAVAGSKPVAVLHDRAERGDDSPGVTVFAGDTLPKSVKGQLTGALGAFPPSGATKTNIDQWTTSALITQLWKDGVPSYSLLWMAEPDYSQHKFSPGAPEPMAGIRNCDNCLARVLQALKEKNVEDSTDIILVSDHGFSTIQEFVDVGATLNQAGLHAFRKMPENPNPGDIMLVTEGGAVLCYVTGHDTGTIEKAVHFLQTQPSTGVLFTQKAVEGTFPLAKAHMESPFAPDIVVVMRWNIDTNKFGVPGMMYCDHEYGVGNKASHATLSPTEMHNTGFAFGPDFIPGKSDSMPTGNIDIAPTILWILGIEPKTKMSGRVLSEALTGATSAPDAVETHRDEASWQGNGIIWRQYLETSTVGGVDYFDKGNGAQESSQAGAK